MNVRLDPLLLATENKQTEELQSIKKNIAKGLIGHSEIISLAQSLEQEHNYVAAGNLYQLWIRNSPAPNKHFIVYNYAAVLQTQKQFEEAKTAYELCIHLDPGFGQAYVNLGLLHEKQGRSTEALATWILWVNRAKQSTSQQKKLLTVALNHIGRVQEDLKNYEQSLVALEESLLIDPDQPGVIQHWVHIRQKSCVWPLYKALPGISIETLRKYTSPLAMLAITEDPFEQLESSKSFVSRTYTDVKVKLCQGKVYVHEKLRVGYVSGDFREHAVGFLLPTYLDGHDKNIYELYAYDFSREDRSTLRSNLIKKFDYFRSITNMSDRQAAELILSDEIDILVDLHGISSGARPGIFSLRPAPKQGTYLGFIGPTGMPWIDFVIADEKVLPIELSKHFTEKPIYLNTSFIPSISYQTDVDVPTRKDLGIPEDAFVMGVFGNTYKITFEIFSVWMKLLRRLPNSILWLIDDNNFTTSNLRRQAGNSGIDVGRLIFTPRINHDKFCARLSLLDICLDTFPYNCGSTANDIIHADIPFVSMYGETMVSRMGLSLLSAHGATSNAVRSLVDYENKVIDYYVQKKAGVSCYKYNPNKNVRVDQAFNQLAFVDSTSIN